MTVEQERDLRAAVEHFKWLDDHGALTREEASHIAALAHVPRLLAALETARNALADIELRAEDGYEALGLLPQSGVFKATRDATRDRFGAIASLSRRGRRAP